MKRPGHLAALSIVALCGTANLAAAVSCPFLDTPTASLVLSGSVAVEARDTDDELEGATSCRFLAGDSISKSAVGRLVVAEIATASVVGDPFQVLRPAALVPLVVAGAEWSLLVTAAELGEADFWFAGLSRIEGLSRDAVVLLWADQDGFQTAVLLDAPNRSAEELHQKLTRVARRIVGGH